MKKTLLFKLFTISLLLFGSIGWVNGQALLVENFDYSTGALLTANGWAAHSGGGTQSVDVTTGLSFPGYIGSGIGGAANLDNNGEDVNKTFTEQTTGTIYVAFVIKTEPTNGAGYFLNLGQTIISTTFFSKVWVNATGDGVNVGTATPASYVAITPGTPALLVLKLDYATKLTSFYVFNTFPATEPVIADATATETAAFSNVGSIALRQFNAAEKVVVDGIRVATTWADAVAASAVDVTAPTFTATPNNGDINVAVNTPIVLTFDEAIRNIDNSEITIANLDTLLTLKETDASGVDVLFTATIDATKKIITVTPTTAFANSQVYYAAIAPVEDASDNATTESSMTFTTIAASAATISGVAITETAPYFAGDTITITWVSSNVTDVLIEAWVPSDSAWVELFASTPSDGTEMFTLPNDAQYSTDYKIRVSNLADTTVNAESSIFTIIAVVNDLATLRAQPVNSIVKYAGIATVTFTQTSRNQKYIQDSTAAVLIDDPNTGFIGTYNVGDGITNVVGKILLYHALIEFTPEAATGEHTTGTVIVPEVRTLASLATADQGKLVKIENFAFKTPAQWDTTGIFVKSKNYDIEGQDNALRVYRTAFGLADYIGAKVPVGPISSICIVGQFDAQMQITARSWSDMTVPTIADFDGTPTSILEGDTVQFTDMSTNNPTSWEWTFEGGDHVTSTDQNPLIAYVTKGTYAVTLKATNASGGNNTITKTDYIIVGSVGISTLQSAVTMYPNPTTGRLFITNPAKEKQEIAVFNAVGIQVNSFASADGIISLDIAKQAKGMYLVRITNKVTKSVQFKKIVLY